METTLEPLTTGSLEVKLTATAGQKNWATIASLIETCKLNAVDPFGYLFAILTAIVNGHRRNRIEMLLPWNFRAV